MNERIRELAEQAGLTKKRATTGATIYTRAELQKKQQLQKFAELIVRECAKVCRDQSNEYSMKLDRENCASAIEEHFGVEE